MHECETVARHKYLRVHPLALRQSKMRAYMGERAAVKIPLPPRAHLHDLILWYQH